VAVDAFKALQQRSPDRAGPVFVTMEGEPLQGYKHWFEPAVRDASAARSASKLKRGASAVSVIMK
jgi:hypothetical protein